MKKDSAKEAQSIVGEILKSGLHYSQLDLRRVVELVLRCSPCPLCANDLIRQVDDVKSNLYDNNGDLMRIVQADPTFYVEADRVWIPELRQKEEGGVCIATNDNVACDSSNREYEVYFLFEGVRLEARLVEAEKLAGAPYRIIRSISSPMWHEVFLDALCSLLCFPSKDKNTLTRISTPGVMIGMPTMIDGIWGVKVECRKSLLIHRELVINDKSY